MDGIIDADTHVVESDYIWRMFDKEHEHLVPPGLVKADDAAFEWPGEPGDEV